MISKRILGVTALAVLLGLGIVLMGPLGTGDERTSGGIHGGNVAPGQERHLPHEAWHVVQQKQGRVQTTRQLKSGVNLNDEVHLEREA